MNLKKELTIKENMQLVLEGKQPAWVPSFLEDCANLRSAAIGRKLDPRTGNLVDIFGVNFVHHPDGLFPDHGNNVLTDVTKWRDVFPDINLNSIDWEEDARQLMSDAKEGQVINLNIGGVWEQLHYMMGTEEALVSLMVEPDVTYECLSAIADLWIDAMQRLCKFIKPDFLMFVDHLATDKRMLVSPDTYRTIIKPIHKRICDAIIEIGAIPELHIDGNIEKIIPDLAEIGVKIIQPFQVMNDINRYKEEYGMIAIGGWDAFGPGNREDSTEEDVRQSVRLAMDTYAPTSRYIFWESGITPRFKESMGYLKDEAIKYGHAFYND